MGDAPADHDAREDEKADGDGETKPEGEAGESRHEEKLSAVSRQLSARPAPPRALRAESRQLRASI
jgi:hypothetical protein